MVTATVVPAFLLAASTTNQLERALFDDTFAGVHHLELFDWSLLIPYFCHSDHSVVLRLPSLRDDPPVHEASQEDITPEPPRGSRQLPRVTIQLPLYNERYVVERLIEEVSKMEYPRDLLQIQVLDDSTDDTHPFTEALVREYQAAGRADRVSASDQSRTATRRARCRKV